MALNRGGGGGLVCQHTAGSVVAHQCMDRSDENKEREKERANPVCSETLLCAPFKESGFFFHFSDLNSKFCMVPFALGDKELLKVLGLLFFSE